MNGRLIELRLMKHCLDARLYRSAMHLAVWSLGVRSTYDFTDAARPDRGARLSCMNAIVLPTERKAHLGTARACCGARCGLCPLWVI